VVQIQDVYVFSRIRIFSFPDPNKKIKII
jgi:hypothetical protein